MEALGKLEPEALAGVAPEIVKRLEDSEGGVRRYAVAALGKLAPEALTEVACACTRGSGPGLCSRCRLGSRYDSSCLFSRYISGCSHARGGSRCRTFSRTCSLCGYVSGRT